MQNEHDNIQIEPWMFRIENEHLALFFSFLLVLIIGIVFSYFNLYLFIGLVIGAVIYIRLLQAQYLGNAIRIHQSQFPELFSIFKHHAIKLGISRAALYIVQDPYLNASTIGITSCTVILNSALVEQLTEKELSYVIAHELGHYKAGHTKISSLLTPLGNQNPISNIIFGFWNRKAEYTCDRCALILTKDIDSGISTLLKLSLGLNLYKRFNVQGFISQLKKAENRSVTFGELLASHPVLTNRIKNLLIFWRDNFKLKYEM